MGMIKTEGLYRFDYNRPGMAEIKVCDITHKTEEEIRELEDYYSKMGIKVHRNERVTVY